MKEELSALRVQYPKQIAMLKGQLNDIDRQLEKLDKEETRSGDIVKLCEQDISYLEDQRDVVGSVYADARVIEHRGSKYTVAEAEQLVTRISETREIYNTRLDDIATERNILQGEKDQITVELQGVEAEQAEFEAEYQSLVREIERLKRNEELLKVAEGRKGIGDDGHSEAMATLDQVKSAVAFF